MVISVEANKSLTKTLKRKAEELDVHRGLKNPRCVPGDLEHRHVQDSVNAQERPEKAFFSYHWPGGV